MLFVSNDNLLCKFLKVSKFAAELLVSNDSFLSSFLKLSWFSLEFDLLLISKDTLLDKLSRISKLNSEAPSLSGFKLL